MLDLRASGPWCGTASALWPREAFVNSVLPHLSSAGAQAPLQPPVRFLVRIPLDNRFESAFMKVLHKCIITNPYTTNKTKPSLFCP